MVLPADAHRREPASAQRADPDRRCSREPDGRTAWEGTPRRRRPRAARGQAAADLVESPRPSTEQYKTLEWPTSPVSRPERCTKQDQTNQLDPSTPFDVRLGA